MSIINDGGPAFPVTQQREQMTETGYRTVSEPHGGMSLRDYFAGQALAGWGESYHAIAWLAYERTPDAEAIAATCYSIADAMLKARE